MIMNERMHRPWFIDRFPVDLRRKISGYAKTHGIPVSDLMQVLVKRELSTKAGVKELIGSATKEEGK